MAKSAGTSTVEIHPTAVVSPHAELDEGVVVGPFCVIGDHVRIGKGTVLGPHVHLDGWTEIGRENQILTGAVIGSPPQDLKYRPGTRSFVRIGDQNTIREYVTVNRATGEDETTSVGSRNLLMAYAHVAHNCELHDGVVMANVASLAGHIVVESNAILGGLVAVHQFVRIGRNSIIGGASAVRGDVLPYCTYAGNPARPYGLNLEGMRRRNFPRETVRDLKRAYRIIFARGLSLDDALVQLRQDLSAVPEVGHIIEFLTLRKRYFAR